MRLTPNNNICEPAKPITTDWSSINWNKPNRHVTSLQRRIYRASRENNKKIFIFYWMKVCLSRMSGKGHVRFLGEGKKAISLPYPTSMSNAELRELATSD